MNIFYELTIVLLIAGLLSLLISVLKQPAIVAYIITGLIVGPLGLFKIQNSDAFNGLAQIGITLLLFMVGLELDITQLKKIGRTVLLVGIGQVVITTLLGYAIVRALGFSLVASLYIAPALTFSSTIVVVKLLSEKRDLNSLYGKLVVGIFLTQDFIAILILISLSSFFPVQNSLYSNLPVWENILLACIRCLILLLGIFWLSKKVFPKILEFIGRNEELQLVFALAWALGLASFVSLPFMGFNLEIGGFMAGLSLAGSAVHFELSSRVKSIRDFFIIIFFIVLGSGLVLNNILALSRPAIILSAFVLIGNPIIVMILLGLFGYKPRTGFLASVTVAQISEFSLILVALGYKLGQLGPNELGLVTFVAMVTIAASSYMIKYSAALYNYLKPLVQVFDFRKGSAERHMDTREFNNHVLLIGAHRLGHHLLHSLATRKQQFLVIDFNPEVVEECLERGIAAICGDITDPYIQQQANIDRAKLIISTVPDYADNLALLEGLSRMTQKKRRKPKLIFIAQNEEEIKQLYSKDIDYVISPHFMGGMHLVKILENRDLTTGLKKLREHHLRVLQI